MTKRTRKWDLPDEVHVLLHYRDSVLIRGLERFIPL